MHVAPKPPRLLVSWVTRPAAGVPGPVSHGLCPGRSVSRGEAQRISARAWVLGHIREPLCRPAALTAGLLPLCHRVQGPSLLTAVVGWLTRSLSRLSPGATQGPSLGRSRCPSHVCFPPATCWLHVGVVCSRRRVFPLQRASPGQRRKWPQRRSGARVPVQEAGDRGAGPCSLTRPGFGPR